jgi:tetratricopeptide (TPR) repeat protein
VRRLILPGIPFVLSMALSLSTAGGHLYWQDSGLFLVAVKELGILYPPGFVLYLLLCKAWTLVLWWVDFTYAVHLFSATCSALAAGTIAVAVRDLLATKGPVFHNAEEGGPLAEWSGVSIGCLAASGYTFWAAAILAKVYAFYFLILSLLLWRMIRADESGKPRDFTILAVLIGLAWQAHPSSVNSGMALVLFVAFHRRVVGWRGIAWRTGLAATCALGPLLLLPLLRGPGSGSLMLGNPTGWDGFWDYASGARFTHIPGVFGLAGSRVASVGRYFWEEFLGIGTLLVGAGIWILWNDNRRLLFGLAVWVVPVLAVTVLFKLEGQHDHWMLAAWIPLWGVAGIGLSLVGKIRETAVLLALIGTVWAVLANRKDLDQRDYTLAEGLGEYYLKALPENASFATASDDVYGSVLYLKSIRGERPDVFLPSPFVGTSFAGGAGVDVFFERPQDPRALGTLTPDGPLYRRGTGEIGNWKEPIPAEELPPLFRRARGQFVERTSTQVRVRPEPYEKRFLRVLLLARKNRAAGLFHKGEHAEAARLYESILALDPEMIEEPTVVFPLAILEVSLKRNDRAEARFKSALSLDLEPEQRARAYYFLAALCGSRPEAAEWREKAMASPDLAPELRRMLQGR